MPRGQSTGRPKGSREIFLALKGVIIAMRLFYDEQFDAIERKTGVKAGTA